MALTKLLNIVEVCQITPAFSSPNSCTESMSLPLTWFDAILFKLHPVEYLFFFTLIDSHPTLFNSMILPKLKQSLSLALVHFLPLAGKLIWPPNADVPFIKYTLNDGVSLTIAQSNADYSILSGFRPRKADYSHHCVPELPVSDSETAVIALQITLFPNQGFCIGFSSHHGVLDGKCAMMFMKAWAHVCKHLEDAILQSLPPELTPFFDRTLIRDPDGYTMKFLNHWFCHTSSRNTKPMLTSPPQPDLVRATFKLSCAAIKKIREKVLSQLNKDEQQLHLSTFVLTYAYALICLVKAKGLANSTNILLLLPGDCRSSLESPSSANYFGNCVTSIHEIITAETYTKENGLANAAESLSNMVKKFQSEKGEKQLEEQLQILQTIMSPKEPLESLEIVGVAGSPKFEFYGTDFGWGRPKTVEITSIDRTSTFSLNENGDGSGGVEVGLALKEHQMEIFQSIFTNGLEHL